MKYVFSSVTRLSNLPERAFEVQPAERGVWQMGDYVVGEVCGTPGSLYSVELCTGRMLDVAEGDLIVGASGKRAATLEATGDWELLGIGGDQRMHALTRAGLFGKCTSRSMLLPPLLPMHYRGHVMVEGRKVGMKDFVAPVPERPLRLPVVLIVGTSMSAGKTVAARTIIRQLKKAGLKVVGAKLTGAGRFRDILAMSDAGADHVFDFVDAGLPSTICPEAEFRAAARHVLARMAGVAADVAVVEAGASPLEPYNGLAAIEEIAPQTRCTVLCASDPYAVPGVMQAFGRRPDFVTGVATSTRAGIDLVEKLAGIRALDVLDRQSLPELRVLLEVSIGLPLTGA